MARDYGPLREAHNKALDALNTYIEQGTQPARETGVEGPAVQAQIQRTGHEAAAEAPERSAPERPEGHPAARPGWTDRGDMVSQQASAMDQVKANHEARLEALNQHIERADAGQVQAPEIAPDIGRKPDDIER